MEIENGQSLSCMINKRLGKGSYGSVYLLTYTQLQPPYQTSEYALKVIEKYGASAEDEEVTRKELQLMENLHHPSIVFLVDSFEVSHHLVLVLELCEGGDLRSYLDSLKEKTRQNKGMEETLVVRWVQQLVAGLEYMHDKKILHRDLKPQNIFLKNEFNVKIGDLGIARQLVFTSEMVATLAGTPLYISPEIYQGYPYSYKADIWSLGCCVYEMMTLKYAFHAPSHFELLGKIISKPVFPLPRCYSSFLHTLVLSMLKKVPEDRPAARQLLQSLQTVDLKHSDANSGSKKHEADLTRQCPKRPKNARSLQAWRLEMAKALNRFLSHEQMIQSIDFAAALTEASFGSDHHTSKDSLSPGIEVFCGKDQQKQESKNFSKAGESVSIRTEDLESSCFSLCGSLRSRRSYSDQSSATLSDNQDMCETTLKDFSEFDVQKEVLPKLRPLPQPKFPKQQNDNLDRYETALVLGAPSSLTTNNFQPADKMNSHVPSQNQSNHLDYVSEVMDWVRAKLSPPVPSNLQFFSSSALASGGNPGQDLNVSPQIGSIKDLIAEDGEAVATLSEATAEVNKVKQKKEVVTLFTRGQCASFRKQDYVDES